MAIAAYLVIIIYIFMVSVWLHHLTILLPTPFYPLDTVASSCNFATVNCIGKSSNLSCCFVISSLLSLHLWGIITFLQFYLAIVCMMTSLLYLIFIDPNCTNIEICSLPDGIPLPLLHVLYRHLLLLSDVEVAENSSIGVEHLHCWSRYCSIFWSSVVIEIQKILLTYWEWCCCLEFWYIWTCPLLHQYSRFSSVNS